LLGFLVFCTAGYWKRSDQSSQIVSLQTENRVLLERLAQLDSGVVRLKEKMSELSRYNDILRTMADLPDIDPDLRMMGVGGPLLEGGVSVRFSSEELVGKVEADIDQLLRQAKLEKASLDEIREKFSKKKEVLDHTPSIIPTIGYLSSGFGWRRDPFTRRMAMHQGVDIAGRRGTPVYATADGVVSFTGYTTIMGRMVEINHGYGYKTIYGHLSKIVVRRGKNVKRGDKIGEMGNSGRTTGTHLHYQVELNGKPVNPLNYFWSRGVIE